MSISNKISLICVILFYIVICEKILNNYRTKKLLLQKLKQGRFSFVKRPNFIQFKDLLNYHPTKN